MFPMRKLHFAVVVCAFLALSPVVASCGGSSSSSSSSSLSSSSSQDLDCLDLEIEKIDSDKYGTDVLGTATNNCGKAIWMAEMEASCYSSSGSLADRDTEYAEDLASGDGQSFKFIIDATSSEVAKCGVKVIDITFSP